MFDEIVCYCHGYTREAIAEDARRHGRSTILARIQEASRAGRCDCARKNPRGR